MDFGKFHFGTIKIDDIIYEHDVVIDLGRIRKRKPSKEVSRPIRINTGFGRGADTLEVRSARADTDRSRSWTRVKLEARR